MVVKLFLITLFVLISIAYSPKIAYPNPADLVRDGCDIRAVNDEGSTRWHLVIWADLLNVKPDPDCPITPKHSFCDTYSMQPTEAKAHKDCQKFLDGMRKALKKVGR